MPPTPPPPPRTPLHFYKKTIFSSSYKLLHGIIYRFLSTKRLHAYNLLVLYT